MSVSLGIIETYGLTTAIQVADAACKSAAVTVLGYKKVGSGLVSVFFTGEVSAVKSAIDSGVAAIRQPEFLKGQLVIARPEKQVVALLTGLSGTSPAPLPNVTPPVALPPATAHRMPPDDSKPSHPERRTGKKESKSLTSLR